MGGLAKGIYSRMFAWLIERCNRTLSRSRLGDADSAAERFIGVLDIAGFEIFDVRSAEVRGRSNL